MNLGDVLLLSKQKREAKEHYLKAKQIYHQVSGNKYDAFFDGKIKECSADGDRDTRKDGASNSSGTTGIRTNVLDQQKKKECVIS